jgi:type 1 fimbria pilin
MVYNVIKLNNINLFRVTSYLLATLILIFVFNPAFATISGAHGYRYNKAKNYIICGGSTSLATETDALFVGNYCTLTPADRNMYVPHSGNYRVEIVLGSGGTYMGYSAQTSAAYFDENKPIYDQNVSVSGTNVYPGALPATVSFDICYRLVDDAGNKYAMKVTNYAGNCTGDTPLPPTPPAPPTSCSINNGNTLNVNLGTVERSSLVTAPGTGPAQHVQIPVNCTGNVASIPVSMKLDYTPLIIGAQQVVNSSLKGLGVAIIYNNKPISTSDNTVINFLSGSNVLDLGFEAVRDPKVSIADVPTGAFTASATLIMTQQ